MKYTFFLITSVLFLTSCSQDWNSEGNTPPGSQSSNSGVHTTGATIADIQATTSILQDAYSEERLAEAIYTKIFAMYPALSEISNIIQSEEKHSEQVGRLLDARHISRTTDYGSFNETYTTLSQMVESGLTGAIEVGVMVEVGDIDHLLEEYKRVEDADVRRVFENIGGGSFNHLRAFLRAAASHSYSVTTDYSRYMSPADITINGPLQGRMTELLISNNLPTYSSTERRGGRQGQSTGR